MLYLAAAFVFWVYLWQVFGEMVREKMGLVLSHEERAADLLDKHRQEK